LLSLQPVAASGELTLGKVVAWMCMGLLRRCVTPSAGGSR